jgi:hypothetical protein
MYFEISAFAEAIRNWFVKMLGLVTTEVTNFSAEGKNKFNLLVPPFE